MPEFFYIAPDSHIIGDVTLGKNTSVWYSSVLRGDKSYIRIGENVNIQDASVLHVDADYPIHLADGVSIGHGAMLHGCSVGENSLIGIGAILLNGAKIGRDSIVAAGSLVTMHKTFPDGMLILGSPAHAVRPLTPEEIESNRKNAKVYLELSKKELSPTACSPSKSDG